MLYLAMSIRAEADASYCYDEDIVLLLPTQYCYHAVIQTSYTYYHTGRLTEHPQPPFFLLSKAEVIQNLIIEHFKYTYKDYIGVLESFSGAYTRGVWRYKFPFFK